MSFSNANVRAGFSIELGLTVEYYNTVIKDQLYRFRGGGGFSVPCSYHLHSTYNTKLVRVYTTLTQTDFNLILHIYTIHTYKHVKI